ncbi:Uncharacterised protein [Mycobacterium tuberculosis]|nr:Uncharacterised protein [Mycobacterium tuberculosis]
MTVVSPRVMRSPSFAEMSPAPRLRGAPQMGVANSSLVSVIVQSASLITTRARYFCAR